MEGHALSCPREAIGRDGARPSNMVNTLLVVIGAYGHTPSYGTSLRIAILSERKKLIFHGCPAIENVGATGRSPLQSNCLYLYDKILQCMLDPAYEPPSIIFLRFWQNSAVILVTF
jgi:hypothetical protein